MKKVLNFVKKFPLSSYALVSILLIMMSKIFSFQYDEPFLGTISTIFGIGLGYMIILVESWLISLKIISSSAEFNYPTFLISTVFSVFIFFLADLILFFTRAKLNLLLSANPRSSSKDK